jgi:hypothetical protein
MENFKKTYSELEMRVLIELRNRIEKSEHNSNFVDGKAIRVNVYDYEELVLVNDKLTFIDKNGYQFSLYADITLEDLVDILSKL